MTVGTGSGRNERGYIVIVQSRYQVKITRRQLRGAIREAMSHAPSHSEVTVINALRRMSDQRGLPVTHEFPADSLDSVMRDGAIRGTYGIFFTLGHLRSPQFVTGPGYMVHGYIPHEHISSGFIYPDMRFVTGDDDEFEDAWEAMWSEQRGDLRGLEVSTSYDEWPSSQWSAVIDNQTGKRI